VLCSLRGKKFPSVKIYNFVLNPRLFIELKGRCRDSRYHPPLHDKLRTAFSVPSLKTPQMKPLRPDEIERDVEKLQQWFGDVIVRISERSHHEYASLADPRVGKQFTL
jgi:hypothetical protein